MTKHEKLIEKIVNGKNISYEDAETRLKKFGFELEIKGSHHLRKILLPYQVIPIAINKFIFKRVKTPKIKNQRTQVVLY